MKRAAIILCVLAVLAFQSGWRPAARTGGVEDSAPGPPESQGAGCREAVARLQRAVTTEAHAYADERRTVCQFMSLPAEMREGKPQAINDSMLRSLREARGESAAASSAAAGCDTTGVKRPEVVDQGSFAAYNTCIANSPVMPCDRRLNADAYIRCLDEQEKRKYARWRECEGLISRVDCRVKVEELDGQTNAGEESAVTVPPNVKPECRDAYVRSVAAGRESERARKRVRELAPNFGAAGARGTAMYNAAREDLRRASEKKAEADGKLRACQSPGGGEGSSSSASNFNLAGSWTAHWGNGSEIGAAAIEQQGDSLTFYDLCCGKTSKADPHNKSKGHFEGGDTVIAEDWGGAGTGMIVENGNRINWSNGTYWAR